jgi:hypothetical protein
MPRQGSQMHIRLAIATGALCLFLSACSVSAMQGALSAAEGNFEKTMVVGDGPVSLDAITASGDITIHHGSDREVHVLGHVVVYRGGWWTTISPQEALARLQPLTTMGSVSSNFLVGSVGGGGPLVELSAQSGYISID